MENNRDKKLPDQYYLQQKIKGVLDKEGKTGDSAIKYLRRKVRTNLEQFRKDFNEAYPITNNEEEKIERENEITRIKAKYFFNAYFKYITEEKISPIVQDSCMFLENGKANTRTINNFLAKDFTEDKDYRTTEVLDFLSISLEFEGMSQSIEYDFDIANKPPKSRNKKRATESNQEILGKVEDTKEQILENQNNTSDEIKSEIKGTNLVVEKAETNILNEIKTLFESFSLKNELKNQQEFDKLLIDAELNPLLFIKDVFNEIIESRKLSKNLIGKIKLIFNPENSSITFNWVHRVILSNAIGISILKGWEEEKVKILKDLIEYKNEPLVVEKSIIGITISLIISSSNESQFKITTSLFNNISDDSFNLGVYKSLNFFLYEFKKSSIKGDKINLFQGLKTNYNFQIFEPIHEDLSYLNVNIKVNFSFYTTLNTSYAFNRFDRFKILFLLNNHPKKRLTLFLDALNDEKRSTKEAYELYGETVNEVHLNHKYDNILNDFAIQCYLFNNVDKDIKNLIKRINKKFLIKTIFENFPHHSYITILNLKTVTSNLTKKNPNHRSYLSKERLKYLKKSNNDYLKSNYYFYVKSLAITKDLTNFHKIEKFLKETEDLIKNPEVLQKAVENYREDYPIPDDANFYSYIGDLLRDLATIENTSKLFHRAIKYYKKSIDIHEHTYTIGEIGKCLVRISEIENKPKISFEESDFYYTNEQQKNDKQPILEELGNQFGYFGSIKKSISYFKKSYSLKEDLIISYRIAENYWKLKKYYKAKEYFNNCLYLKIAKPIDDPEKRNEYMHCKSMGAMYSCYVEMILQNDEKAFLKFKNLCIDPHISNLGGFYYTYEGHYPELSKHGISKERLDNLKKRFIDYVKSKPSF